MSIVANDATVTLNTLITVDTEGVAIDYLDWIVLVNASPFSMNATIGSLNFHIPAWYYYPIALRDAGTHKLIPGVQLPLKCLPTAQTIPGTVAVSTLHTTLFQTGEVPTVTFPQPLGGSPINLSIATSLVSLGLPAGTIIVAGQPASDNGTNAFPLTITNDGKIVLGDVNNPAASLKIFGNALGANQFTSALVLLVVPLIMFNNQPLQWNDNTNLAQHTVMLVDNNNVLTLSAIPGGGMLLNSNDGASQIDLETTGCTFRNALTLNPPSVALAGSVSGTVNCYEYIQGTFKRCLVIWNNYKSAAAQTLTLPSAYTFGAYFQAGETQAQTIEFLSGGVAQTCSVQATVAAAGGTQAPEVWTKSWSQGQVRTGFNQLRFTFTATAAGGFMILEGQ